MAPGQGWHSSAPACPATTLYWHTNTLQLIAPPTFMDGFCHPPFFMELQIHDFQSGLAIGMAYKQWESCNTKTYQNYYHSKSKFIQHFYFNTYKCMHDFNQNFIMIWLTKSKRLNWQTWVTHIMKPLMKWSSALAWLLIFAWLLKE